ncbi:uncharacterized protein KY384_005976 [Bacidia gigantensis]|uniref:uncharacterized protein n=1 Tax=Bacidia gigantensis TaxID=2732470 RepID=UPI001D04F14E|nr:uncharacterized protein KY384_005976 [Bacidia gigantensis]KAG8529340.1 hypothetical protein KY384_005976 [Bacidia gigantensis]
MPNLLSNVISEKVSLQTNEESPYNPPSKSSGDPSQCVNAQTNSQFNNGGLVDLYNDHVSDEVADNDDQERSRGKAGGKGNSKFSAGHIQEQRASNEKVNGSIVNGKRASQDSSNDTSKLNGVLKSPIASSAQSSAHSKQTHPKVRRSFESGQSGKGWQKGHGRAHSASAPQNPNATYLSSIQGSPPPTEDTIFGMPDSVESPQRHTHPAGPAAPNPSQPTAGSSTSSLHPTAPRLHHRHTLEVPRVSTSRTSRDFSLPNTISDVASETGRFTPTLRTPRASNTIARAQTRSIHSDMFLDEIPPDSDMARWAETVRYKRASRRKRKEEEEDDRVVVGTKVDINHVNWVTAYNMLTGIRFTVSRTNAKIDRPDDPLDFDARHKFSFDITGNELTPSAKYDFKFKDYAPRVFRRLRAKFRIDPADYLVSLTSKYILSELGSPGKSGSFFYFSRDYKYIIKTIHHAEHKLLRQILQEYYKHIEDNPDTLLSQFYGLHRVKIPYGRKIHFVVMNNLFPPHRDIHQTFDLKGSTIGRDFKEEDAAKNPRATLKDLNWLRRKYHFEFGPLKKRYLWSR